MAMIKAGWKRTVRVKEYESETLELAVEKNIGDDFRDVDLVAHAKMLDKLLAEAGDALVVERLEARLATITSHERPIPVPGTMGRAPRSEPQAPDVDPLV